MVVNGRRRQPDLLRGRRRQRRADGHGILTPTGDKHIGALQDGGLAAQFGGDLDDLRLYDRSLSAAEVGRLAQGRGCVTDGLAWATSPFTTCSARWTWPTAGDEIWVAKSFEPYRPGTSPFARFNLVSGVGLYGNFNGTETSRAQRPPVNFQSFNVSRLSGDLLGTYIGGPYSDNASMWWTPTAPAPAPCWTASAWSTVSTWTR